MTKDNELFKNVDNNVDRASNWSDFRPSNKSQRHLKKAMEEEGVEAEDVEKFMKKEYAPTPDRIKLDNLVPVMCENLAKDIEEGRLD